MVQFFGQTRWDLSWVEELGGESSLLLSQPEYDSLWADEAHLERRALLARAHVHRDGLRVAGAKRYLDALRTRLEAQPRRRIPSGRRIARGKRIALLRIRLQRVKPPIWRCVELPVTATLAQLHRVVQLSMGWKDAHLHRFRQGGAVYGNSGEGVLGPVTSERGVRIGDLLVTPGDSLLYEYDFGDGWVHEVRLEGHLGLEPDARYPRCVKGRRACPPEDIGGPWGYADWLARRRLPVHGAAQRRLRALPFDPEAFDLEGINSRLRRLRLAPPEGT
jgi:hypothetical protein